MSPWRPLTKDVWWLAFMVSWVVVAPAFVIAGLFLAQGFGAPSLYLAARLLAPVLACYLVAVTKHHLVVKLTLVPSLFAAIFLACTPRSPCGEGTSPDLPNVRQVSKDGLSMANKPNISIHRTACGGR